MLLGIFSIKVGLMEAGANMVRSWLKMTKVEKIFEKEEAMKETRSQAEKDKAMEIAKNLMDILSEEMISKKTGLSAL